jgi:hypothetical protein
MRGPSATQNVVVEEYLVYGELPASDLHPVSKARGG